MDGKRIAYIRVSTVEQNEARQREALQRFDIEKWYVEKASAKDTNRPKLQELLDFVREGDELYIHDFSRIARSTKDLLNICETLDAKGVRLISNKENIDTSNAAGKLMLTILGAIYEFERENLLERQREGISIAKREKRYKGRKSAEVDETEFSLLLADYQKRRISKKEFAESKAKSKTKAPAPRYGDFDVEEAFRLALERSYGDDDK